MHYYQFNIGDYQTHTAHLTHAEDLAYRRLLDWQYLNEKPIPSDISRASKLIRMNECLTDVEQVLNEFFELVDDGYINSRAYSEIDAYAAKREKASKAGKASGKARKHKAKQQFTSANGRATDVEQTLNQPLTINHKPLTKNQEPKKEDDALSRFGEFWAEYPKKKSKGQAEKAWAKIEAFFGEIMEGLEKAKESDDWKKDGGKYIPHPATWLNARGWEDEYEVAEYEPDYEEL